MTAMQDLVVHVSDDVASGQAVALASSLAADLGGRLRLVLVAMPSGACVGLNAEAASLALELAQGQRQALTVTGERLAAGVQQHHPGLHVDWRVAEGDPVEVLTGLARTADLLVTSQRDPGAGGGLSVAQAARLLVGSACPVLTVPYIGWGDGLGTTSPCPALRRVLVAWSDTRESARALRDALPLLVRANRVELVSFASADRAEPASRYASLQQVAAYLGGYGVQATVTVLAQAEPSASERMWRGGVPDLAVAEALLSHAADMQADCIVMGGYGHSRLWELVLGGVTRTMLGTMTVPVLMSH